MGDAIGAIDTENNVKQRLNEEIDKTINVVETLNDKIDTVIDCVVDISEKKKKPINQESIACECGGHYVNRNRTRHVKTAKHQNYISKIEVVDDIINDIIV
jgi:hypothetical protein